MSESKKQDSARVVPPYRSVANSDPFAGLIIKDEHLRDVLRGEAYLMQDGAMGTMLQMRGLLDAGALPELLNIQEPKAITELHEAYINAGAEMITTNTFGANAHKLGDKASVSEVYRTAIQCARDAGARYVGADIGPLGMLLAPLGTLTFDEAYELFAEQVRAARDGGADILVIETMTDILEIKAAVLAAKEHSSLPIFASMTYDEDGRTFLGTSPEVAAITLSALGVQVVGVNCSLGPKELIPLAKTLIRYASCPVGVRPNAGLPRVEGDETVYDVTAEDYASALEEIINAGATIIGGCCGTDPSYIAQLAPLVRGRKPSLIARAQRCSVTSAQNAVILEEGEQKLTVVGERINPTGKSRLKEALRTQNYDYLIGEAIAQQQAQADILDVNVGLPEIDEKAILVEVVNKLQAICPLPLQIDSSDPLAIEAAVRVYAGKPLVNSVNGKQESLEAILPIIKHYGCTVVGLTLDERGIPSTAEGRYAIAEKIVKAAEVQGISRDDVVIDCLVMAAATNQTEVQEILRTITLVKQRLGVRTMLGVSNVSFGLPQRELLNATFLAAACGVGLDLPILNPLSERYQDVVNSFKVLNAEDPSAQAFIERYAAQTDPYSEATTRTHKQFEMGASNEGPQGSKEQSTEDRIQQLVMTGRKSHMEEATLTLLETCDSMDVINKVFIPALDKVGEKFERGEFFLPQMMASAEAVKAGFDTLRTHSKVTTPNSSKAICLATVKGDIHDIGKNIVKMLLENYGYTIYDLGRDVAPETILATVQEHDIKLVGLSALMTTTVRSMEETIALLHERVPDCKVFVGGAVLSRDYAEMIGADYYGKDAAESARIAARFFSDV